MEINDETLKNLPVPVSAPTRFLDFEQPIAELEAKIEELQSASTDARLNISDEIARLRQRSRELTENIFSKLSPWQIARLARHPLRPYALDYVERVFDEVHELHGDRMFADDAAIVSGLARLDGMPLVFIGQQKGRTTKENLRRNFGMPKPEGYRKALRMMELAQRFELPIVTFIDTAGADPGIGAEERGQSEAIARNLLTMVGLTVPVVAVVIGEGGSGGALAIGVADKVLMLQYSTYSVISPQGCASILWKDAKKAEDAAQALGITSKVLLELGLVDQVIQEPSGGAHRDYDASAASVKQAVLAALNELNVIAPDVRQAARAERYLSIGKFEDA